MFDRRITENKNKEKYKKFTSEQIEVLQSYYDKVIVCYFNLYIWKTKYPKKIEFEKLEISIQDNKIKIENWFKNQRRKSVKKGTFKYFVIF